ncbi:hypothetical protein D9602_16940 [Sphingomonas sp. TX0522]|nr:hypothetical protein [Sphingomonas sp. TX0522]
MGAAIGTVAAACWWQFAPVDPPSEQDAVILARAGPRGARSYETAWQDGKLTRPELRALREAAGEDIDDYFRREQPHRR